MKYINMKSGFTKEIETVDQFETYKETKEMLKEYRISDPYDSYYISQRCCKDWNS